MFKDPGGRTRHGEVAWGQRTWKRVGREGEGRSVQTLDCGGLCEPQSGHWLNPCP